MITFVFKKNAYLFKDQFYLDTVSYKDIVTVVVLKTCTQDLNAETIIGSISSTLRPYRYLCWTILVEYRKKFS